MKSPRKQYKYYPYQVLPEHHDKLEQMAKHRRKKTGENINWSGVLKEILDKHLSKKTTAQCNVTQRSSRRAAEGESTAKEVKTGAQI